MVEFLRKSGVIVTPMTTATARKTFLLSAALEALAQRAGHIMQ